VHRQCLSQCAQTVFVHRQQCAQTVIKSYNILIFRPALALNEHGLKIPVLANTLFGPQFSISQHFEQRNCSLPQFCTTHSFWRSLSSSCMFLYSRTMLSDKQSEHSLRPATSVSLVFVN